jgi:hypothetical protein
MNLIKEFRALLYPWSLAMATAILIPLANFFFAVHVIEDGVFVNSLSGLVVFIFFSSMLAIAASPFGTEFHCRTLPLLLSQPISRSLIWRHKLIAASMGIGIAMLPLVLANFLTDTATQSPAATVPNTALSTVMTPTTQPTAPAGMSREQAIYERRYGIKPPGTESTNPIPATPAPATPASPKPELISSSEITITACALFLPTLCSVSFWTLLARSTLGGMVFTVFSQLLVFGILSFISERFGLANSKLGIRSMSAQTPIFALAGIVYCCMFLSLSWRKFSRLEVSQLSPGTLASSKSLTAQGFGMEWLRCRPTSGFLNLVRKEIQLQRPVFIIAGILCILWALACVYLLLQPLRTTFPEIVFALTIGFYIPLISFLAGSVSLGEEKNLAIVGWHLTFPVSIWRQWAVKLSVGLGIWLILGLLLPFALIKLGTTFSHARVIKELEFDSWLGISLFMTGVCALSFWAMTLFSNTVRAVIGSLVTVIALCSAGTFAFWLLLKFVFPHPVVRTLLNYNTHSEKEDDWVLIRGAILIGASTLVLAFIQSRLQFRLLQTSWRTVAKYSGALVIFVFLATLFYFSLLPFTQLSPAIYLLLFILLLIFVRRMAAPVPSGTDS